MKAEHVLWGLFTAFLAGVLMLGTHFNQKGCHPLPAQDWVVEGVGVVFITRTEFDYPNNVVRYKVRARTDEFEFSASQDAFCASATLRLPPERRQ